MSPPKQREFAADVVRQLRGAGYQALWAGGCVRDQLMGRQPKDYDVATSATPDQIRAVFGKRRTLPIGAAFGVITVLGPRDAGQIEVATFRQDADYSDGRHPDAVTFSTPEHDAQRRDFTINGLFYDPLNEKVIDFVGGQQDLQDRVIRAIGDPGARIDEDKLRMLRSVRFAATLGFEIEPATFAAVCSHSHEVALVSAERITAELRRMWHHANGAVATDLLLQTNLLEAILPVTAKASPGLLQRRALGEVAQQRTPRFTTHLAILLRHLPFDAATDIDRLAQDLKLTNEEAATIRSMLQLRNHLLGAPDRPWSVLQRLLIHPRIEDVLDFAWATAEEPDHRPNIQFCREKLRLPAEQLNPPTLIDGNDLLRMGLKPGPKIRELLDRVRSAQLDQIVATREEAIAMVQDLL